MFNRIVHWFVPAAHQREVEVFRQSRLLVSACLLTSVFSTSFTGLSVLTDFEEAIWATGFAAVSYFVLPFVFRWSGGRTLTANLYVLVGTLDVVVCTYFSGGLTSHILPWLVALPNAGLLLGGARVGRLWTGISIAILVVFGVLAAQGYAFPRRHNLDPEVLSVTVLSTMSGLILIVFVIALVFQQEKERAFAQLFAKNEELRQAIDELRETQVQLVHQEKLASLGQLTAGIAHEIKNPLNFVNNFALNSVDLADELDETLRGHPEARGAVEELVSDLKLNARKIAEHGRRADGIVHTMLDHSSNSRGTRQPTDLNALLEEYVHLSYHGLRGRRPDLDVRIEQRYDPALRSVDVVPQEIGRVVLNLLNNAFYAVHERQRHGDGAYEPTVSVATRGREGQAEIRIGDNGSGIPTHLREKIFEPFFTTKPPGEGTGLGLSLSYEIVIRGHGGRIDVECPAGGGTTFILSLPMKQEPARLAQTA